MYLASRAIPGMFGVPLPLEFDTFQEGSFGNCHEIYPITAGLNEHLKLKARLMGSTAKVYKFICTIFRRDKTSLYQGLEKFSEK